MTYLNHAGTSWPKPTSVRAAVDEALGSEPGTWPLRLARAQERVAAFIGLADASRLLFTPGCTSALAVAIADLPWEPGDRIVTSSLEHHALARPARKLERRGVEWIQVPRAPEGPFCLESLGRILGEGRVRLVATTAASNVTGELLPTRAIGALAHAAGALQLVDAAQLAGWLPLEVDASGADLVAFAGHKALHGPWGVGALIVAAHVTTDTPGAVCALPAAGSAPACDDKPGYCDVGSVDHAAVAGLAAALDWLELPENASRLARARERARVVEGALRELPGARVVARADFSAKLPFVAFDSPRAASSELAAELAKRGVVVGSGLQCAPAAHTALGTAPGGVVRLSFGPTNTEGDVEHVVRALREQLA